MTPASVREAVVKVRSEPQGAIGVGSGAQQQRRLRQAVRAWLYHRSSRRPAHPQGLDETKLITGTVDENEDQVPFLAQRRAAYALPLSPSPQIFG